MAFSEYTVGYTERQIKLRHGSRPRVRKQKRFVTKKYIERITPTKVIKLKSKERKFTKRLSFAGYDEWDSNTLGKIKIKKFFKRAFGKTFKKLPRVISAGVTGYVTGDYAGAALSAGTMLASGRRKGEKWYQGALLGAGTGMAIGSATGLVTGKGYVGEKYTSWKQSQIAKQAQDSLIPTGVKEGSNIVQSTSYQQDLKEKTLNSRYKLNVPELLTQGVNVMGQATGLGSNFQPGMSMPIPEIVPEKKVRVGIIEEIGWTPILIGVGILTLGILFILRGTERGPQILHKAI